MAQHRPRTQSLHDENAWHAFVGIRELAQFVEACGLDASVLDAVVDLGVNDLADIVEVTEDDLKELKWRLIQRRRWLKGVELWKKAFEADGNATIVPNNISPAPSAALPLPPTSASAAAAPPVLPPPRQSAASPPSRLDITEEVYSVVVDEETELIATPTDTTTTTTAAAAAAASSPSLQGHQQQLIYDDSYEVSAPPPDRAGYKRASALESPSVGLDSLSLPRKPESGYGVQQPSPTHAPRNSTTSASLLTAQPVATSLPQRPPKTIGVDPDAPYPVLPSASTYGTPEGKAGPLSVQQQQQQDTSALVPPPLPSRNTTTSLSSASTAPSTPTSAPMLPVLVTSPGYNRLPQANDQPLVPRTAPASASTAPSTPTSTPMPPVLVTSPGYNRLPQANDQPLIPGTAPTSAPPAPGEDIYESVDDIMVPQQVIHNVDNGETVNVVLPDDYYGKIESEEAVNINTGSLSDHAAAEAAAAAEVAAAEAAQAAALAQAEAAAAAARVAAEAAMRRAAQREAERLEKFRVQCVRRSMLGAVRTETGESGGGASVDKVVGESILVEGGSKASGSKGGVDGSSNSDTKGTALPVFPTPPPKSYEMPAETVANAALCMSAQYRADPAAYIRALDSQVCHGIVSLRQEAGTDPSSASFEMLAARVCDQGISNIDTASDEYTILAFRSLRETHDILSVVPLLATDSVWCESAIAPWLGCHDVVFDLAADVPLPAILALLRKNNNSSRLVLTGYGLSGAMAFAVLLRLVLGGHITIEEVASGLVSCVGFGVPPFVDESFAADMIASGVAAGCTFVGHTLDAMLPLAALVLRRIPNDPEVSDVGQILSAMQEREDWCDMPALVSGSALARGIDYLCKLVSAAPKNSGGADTASLVATVENEEGKVDGEESNTDNGDQGEMAASATAAEAENEEEEDEGAFCAVFGTHVCLDTLESNTVTGDNVSKLAVYLNTLPDFLVACLAKEEEANRLPSLLAEHPIVGGVDSYVNFSQIPAEFPVAAIFGAAAGTAVCVHEGVPSDMRVIFDPVSAIGRFEDHTSNGLCTVTVRLCGQNLRLVNQVHTAAGRKVSFSVNAAHTVLELRTLFNEMEALASDSPTGRILALTVYAYFQPPICIRVPCIASTVPPEVLPMAALLPGQVLAEALRAMQKVETAAAAVAEDVATGVATAQGDEREALSLNAAGLVAEVRDNVARVLEAVPAEWLLFAEAAALAAREQGDPDGTAAALAFRDHVSTDELLDAAKNSFFRRQTMMTNVMAQGQHWQALRLGAGDVVSRLLKSNCKKALKSNPADAGMPLSATKLCPATSREGLTAASASPDTLAPVVAIHRTLLDTLLATKFPVAKIKKGFMPRLAPRADVPPLSTPEACYPRYRAKLEMLLGSALLPTEFEVLHQRAPSFLEMEERLVAVLLEKCPGVGHAEKGIANSGLHDALNNAYDKIWADPMSSRARVTPPHRGVICRELELVLRTYLLRRQLARLQVLTLVGVDDEGEGEGKGEGMESFGNTAVLSLGRQLKGLGGLSMLPPPTAAGYLHLQGSGLLMALPMTLLTVESKKRDLQVVADTLAGGNTCCVFVASVNAEPEQTAKLLGPAICRQLGRGCTPVVVLMDAAVLAARVLSEALGADAAMTDETAKFSPIVEPTDGRLNMSISAAVDALRTVREDVAWRIAKRVANLQSEAAVGSGTGSRPAAALDVCLVHQSVGVQHQQQDEEEAATFVGIAPEMKPLLASVLATAHVLEPDQLFARLQSRIIPPHFVGSFANTSLLGAFGEAVQSLPEPEPFVGRRNLHATSKKLLYSSVQRRRLKQSGNQQQESIEDRIEPSTNSDSKLDSIQEGKLVRTASDGSEEAGGPEAEVEANTEVETSRVDLTGISSEDAMA